jgi:hypothetical protein
MSSNGKGLARRQTRSKGKAKAIKSGEKMLMHEVEDHAVL